MTVKITLKEEAGEKIFSNVSQAFEDKGKLKIYRSERGSATLIAIFDIEAINTYQLMD